MNRLKKGFTLVEVMIVVAIIALLAAIAIPNLLRARVNSNQALAQSTLRAFSTADESFATANSGSYAVGEAALTTPTPPYLNRGYCTTTVSGYDITCGAAGAALIATGYTVVATPASSSTGQVTYTISTGGVLTQNP